MHVLPLMQQALLTPEWAESTQPGEQPSLRELHYFSLHSQRVRATRASCCRWGCARRGLGWAAAVTCAALLGAGCSARQSCAGLSGGGPEARITLPRWRLGGEGGRLLTRAVELAVYEGGCATAADEGCSGGVRGLTNRGRGVRKREDLRTQ